MSRRALALACLLALTALPPAPAEPTPGVSLSLERIVPEAHETNDYVSYDEARAYLDAIASQAPDLVEVLEVGESFGWDNALTGARDTWPVFVVEVTHEASPVPREEKLAVVFQLSIHGNEKGGREGGLRVIEDLAIPRLYGQDYRALLDTHIIIFTFPNPDGWVHEELPYRGNCPGYVPLPLPTGGCVETQGFVRFNGNGQDLNRDWPTAGWYQTDFGRLHALSEPEMAGMAGYLLPFRGRTDGAADIHGMLVPSDAQGNGAETYCAPENPAGVGCAREGHFVLGLMGDQGDPALNAGTVRRAERAKEYLNAMAQERFPYWTSAPNAGAAGGQWSEWGTGWDTIGYTDSGSTGRFTPQPNGLLAPGGTYELSYNHITVDNHYVPELNAMHVESVRAIVRAFLDEAREARGFALQAREPVAWLASAAEHRGERPAEGAHADSPADDAFEAGFATRPARFWEDLARHAPAGSLVPASPQDVARGTLPRVLAIADAGWDRVQSEPGGVQGLRAWVERGGRLVLTDGALRGLEALGLAQEGSVEQGTAYLGYVDLDLDHALASGVRGLARQTYDGVALGYDLEGQAPVWTVAAEAVEGLDLAGTTLGPDRASLGRVPLGQGEVVFLGALLPPPAEGAYAPYGLADYSVTYTGYQLLYNALGLEPQEAARAPGASPGDGAGSPARPAPFPGLGVLAALAAGLALAMGRTRRP